MAAPPWEGAVVTVRLQGQDAWVRDPVLLVPALWVGGCFVSVLRSEAVAREISVFMIFRMATHSPFFVNLRS